MEDINRQIVLRAEIDELIKTLQKDGRNSKRSKLNARQLVD